MKEQPTADDLARTADTRMSAAQVTSVVTAELIEEHRRNPVGFHSLELERVLRYMRRQQPAGKYCPDLHTTRSGVGDRRALRRPRCRAQDR